MTNPLRAELTQWLGAWSLSPPHSNQGELSVTLAASDHRRWKSHKWRKCQLVPWSLRQSSPGVQETCGPGIQTRGRSLAPRSLRQVRGRHSVKQTHSFRLTRFAEVSLENVSFLPLLVSFAHIPPVPPGTCLMVWHIWLLFFLHPSSPEAATTQIQLGSSCVNVSAQQHEPLLSSSSRPRPPRSPSLLPSDSPWMNQFHYVPPPIDGH